MSLQAEAAAPPADAGRAGRTGMAVHGLTRFRTSDLPGSRKLAGWEEHNARSLVGLRVRPLAGSPFEATELNLALPRLRLAKVTGSPHVVDRDPGQIAACPADGLVVYFALSGRGSFHHRHGCEVLTPGQALVCDADQPFRRRFSRGLTELVLRAPRSVLRETVGCSGLARPRVFGFDSGSDAHGRALAASVAGAFSGTADWEALETGVLDLLAVVLGGESSNAGHLAAARAFVTAHLAEPSLSAGRIAQAVGLSERQLSRLFAASGQSVPQAVLATRLDAVRSALADPANAAASLADLAARHGFVSQAHFSRSDRARFGTTPLRDRRELAHR